MWENECLAANSLTERRSTTIPYRGVGLSRSGKLPLKEDEIV